jgi:hypothetical protein
MTTRIRQSDREVVTVDAKRLASAKAVARAASIVVAGVVALAMAASGAGAHDDGTTSHLWLDHIKPMKSPGVLNDPGNPVDWTKLKSVTDPWKDGTDDGVEAAGFGLKKSGDTFSVEWSKIQHRVKNGCPLGQAIKGIDQSGAAACSAGPRVLSLIVPDTGVMCNVDCTEGFLTLTPGTWSISATIAADQSIQGPDEIWVDCHLDAGGLSNASRYRADTRGDVQLSMQLLATMGQNLHASVNCGDHDVGEVSGTDMSIIALRLD